MSLESYRKTLELQEKRLQAQNLNDRYTREYWKRIEDETDSYADVNRSQKEKRYSQYVESDYRESQHGNNKKGCLLFFSIIFVILIVSVVKNPSEADSKKLIKNFIVEKVNDEMRNKITNDNNDDVFKALGVFIGMSIAPYIIEGISQTTINDCVLFSTFDCTMEVEGSRKTIVSGIILFGKIIPLSSDLNPEEFKI